MRKRNGTRKFRKLRKGTKNYSTRRNKSGGALGTLARYLTSDGRLLEEFKSKIRDVTPLRTLLNTPDVNLIRVIVSELKMANNIYKVNYGRLKTFVTNNNKRLIEILQNMDMQIEKRGFYLKVLEEVADGDFSMEPAAAPLPPAHSLPPTPASLPGMGDESASKEEYQQTTNKNKEEVYVLSDRECPLPNTDGEPPYFTCDYPEQPDNAVCRLCYKSKRDHKKQEQGGGSRRRRRNTRSRKNKTRRNGKCRACRCPGGCKRSTCPCYRGRSKPCCTKKCKSRGHRCRC
jgi:hypothetical protein